MGCGNPKGDVKIDSTAPREDRVPTGMDRMEETKSKPALAVKTDREMDQAKATEQEVAVE